MNVMEKKMSYKIGSFNVQHLSSKDETVREKKFKDIAHIIRNQQFDIVALQEVLNEESVKSLVNGLGNLKWDHVYMEPNTYASKKEGYAYIWRNDRVRLVDDENGNPIIYNRYTKRHKIGTQGLVRPPLVARFTPDDVNGGPFVEFRLINTHIAFSSSVNAIEAHNDSELRRMEYEILTKDVYRLISTMGTGNNMPSYTFLMGDYNLCLTSNNAPKIEDTITISQGRTGDRNLITVQDRRTTVKQANENNKSKNAKELLEEDLYSNDFDHFTYDEIYPTIMKLENRRVDALGTYYKNDVENYRAYISDHVPIKLVIDLKNRERG